MNKLEKIISIVMLIFAMGFNLWLYRLEPTATFDPNDNTFQYALVLRTNEVWNLAQQRCEEEKGKRQMEKGNLIQKLLQPASTFTFCLFPFTLLVDHWVPNWAQGYNLPFYYSHMPQIMIVGSYRLIQSFGCQLSAVSCQLSLFTYYHLVIYLLLCFFPLSVFLALRVIKIPWLAAGFGALIATHISTDGLYGIDPPSFLWRGYGLSSQLFGMMWLPLAIAYSFRYLTKKSGWEMGDGMLDMEMGNGKKDQKISRLTSPSSFSLLNSQFSPAVLFLVLTAMGHLGLGIIAILGIGALAVGEILRYGIHPYSYPTIQPSKSMALWSYGHMVSTKLLLLISTTIFFLSYWVIPILLNNNYHNNSFWDPIWKFNSYPWKETLTRLFNGELYDFGRLPVFTGLVGLGLFASLWPRKVKWEMGNGKLDMETGNGKKDQKIPHLTSPSSFSLLNSQFSFAFLFIIYMALYFGRTTWGGLIDLIPGMKDFHISRFIVGLHLAGLFLAPIGVSWIAEKVSGIMRHVSGKFNPAVIGLFAYSLISLLAILALYPQTIRYNDLNDKLIVQGNKEYAKWNESEAKLFDGLNKRTPGRVYVGRGANWGADFKVADVTMFVHMSTYGYPTILWLPETWSPSSDVEQYFVDDWQEHFDLFNLNTVVTPPEVKPLPFWKLEQSDEKWKRYSVPTSGYFTSGVRVATVATTRETFINAVHLWLQSDNVKKGWFPQLSFLPLSDFNSSSLPAFGMVDETTYKTRDNVLHNLFEEKPVYLSPQQPPTATSGTEEKRILLTGPEEVAGDIIFKTKVHVPQNCTECLLILKQTYHPNWKAYVDGKRVETFTVFPFLTAIKLDQQGDYMVEFRYEASGLKVLLLTLEVVALCMLLLWLIYLHFTPKHPHSTF